MTASHRCPDCGLYTTAAEVCPSCTQTRDLGGIRSAYDRRWEHRADMEAFTRRVMAQRRWRRKQNHA